MTPQEAISIVDSRSVGRTRWMGQEDFLDEVLVQEVRRLRKLLDTPPTWLCPECSIQWDIRGIADRELKP